MKMMKIAMEKALVNQVYKQVEETCEQPRIYDVKTVTVTVGEETFTMPAPLVVDVTSLFQLS